MQVLNMSELVSSYLEEINQDRPVPSGSAQQHRPMPATPRANFRLLTLEKEAENEAFNNFQRSNRSNSNNDLQNLHIPGGILNYGEHSRIASEICNSNLFLSDIQDSETSKLYLEAVTPQPHNGEINSESNYNVLGLATPHLRSSVGRMRANIKDETKTFSQKQIRNRKEIFSESTREEMKSVLGNDNLYHALVNVIVELQQLNAEKTASQHKTNNEIVADISRKYEGQGSTLYGSTSADNLESRTSSLLKQSAFQESNSVPYPIQKVHKFQENILPSSMITQDDDIVLRCLQQSSRFQNSNTQSSHVMPRPCTKNVTHTFSADEIYQKAYENNSQPYQKQHEHITSGSVCHSLQGRQENPLDGSSRFPNNSLPLKSTSCIPQNFTQLYPVQELPELQACESSFSNAVPVDVQDNPTSSLIPQNRPQPQPKYKLLDPQLPTDHHPGLNTVHPYSSSQTTSANLQPPPNTTDNLDSSACLSFGVLFPFYLSPYDEHVIQPPLDGVIQQPLQPHPPAIPKECVTKQLVPNDQKISHPTKANSNQQTLASVTPDEMSEFCQKAYNIPCLWDVNKDNTYPGPHEQFQDVVPDYFRDYNLQRYFSSLEANNTLGLVSSSQDLDVDSFKINDIVDSEIADFMGTTDTSAGGVTQRLNDLHIDLDLLKHLRVHDANRDESSAGFKMFPYGIKFCPECKSSNKAYMNWCTGCGDLLIGVEPTLPREELGHNSSEKKDVMGVDIVTNGMSFMYETSKERDNTNESLETGKGFSVSDPPADDSRKKSEREFNDFLKDSIKLTAKKDLSLWEDNIIADERKKQFNYRKEEMCNNMETDFLAEVKDPILRDLIISCKKRHLLQKADHKMYPKFQEFVVMPVFTNNTMANLSAKESLMSSTDQENKLENFLESSTATQQVQVSNSARISLENEVRKEDNGVLLSHKYKTNNSFEMAIRKLQELEIYSKDKELLDFSKTKNTATDTRVCEYEESHKGNNQPTSKVIVPALKLICSSDEEIEVVKDEIVDKGQNDRNLCAPPQASAVEMNAQCLPKDYKNNATFKTRNRRPTNRISAQLTKPCLDQSEVPLHHRNQPNGNSVQHQRHWARSSIAWRSYNPRELNTRSSLPSLHPQNGPKRGSFPVLAPNGHEYKNQLRPAVNPDIPEAKVGNRPSSANKHRQPSRDLSKRPSSASVSSRGLHVHPPEGPYRNGWPKAILKRNSAVTHVQRDTNEMKARPDLTVSDYQESSSLTAARTAEAVHQTGHKDDRKQDSHRDSAKLLCAKFHRLPQKTHMADNLHVVAKNAYEKLKEMTPRITEGVLSKWQCLPDEIWLFILNFLSHSDLKNVMQACRYFQRLANDESLWKYITLKSMYAVTDELLAVIAHHQPLSLAMVKCQGHSLSLDGLKYFFKETQGRLRELNICGCNQGSLVGSVVLTAAAEFCQQLTHLDASFCQLNNEAVLAIFNSAIELESVCLNGFQLINDTTLMTLLRKHGKSLRTLELYACFSLSAFAFHSIGELCPNLRRLCLGNCNKLTDIAMISLSTYLGKIQELDLRGCKNLWNDCIQKIVRNCPCIHTLVLANCYQISDIALTEIATHLKSTLRVLDVCGCNRITDNGVANLVKNCNKLISLDISSTRCTNVCVKQLSHSPSNQCLETVRLSFLLGLTEACLLALIHQCPRLKSIHVFGCTSLRNLEKLQAANPKLSVEGDNDDIFVKV